MIKSIKSKPILWSSYFIFFASLIVLAFLYFSWLRVQATPPTVSFEREGSVVTITSAPRTGYEMKYLGLEGNEHWLYTTVASESRCSARYFSGGQKAYWIPDTLEAEFTFDDTSTQDVNFCIKVLYGLTNNNNSWLEYYAYFSVDKTAPTMTLAQNGLFLEITATDSSGIRDWYMASSTSQITDCTFSSYAAIDPSLITITTSGQKQIAKVTLTSLDNDLYYCVRLTDNQDNDAYSTDDFQVDTIAPVLSANQDNAVLTITVRQDDDQDNNNDGNSDIDVSSWQYAIVSNNVCNVSTRNWRDITHLTDDATKDRALITLTTSIDDRTYCFRVADEAKNSAYALISVDTINSPPVLSSVGQNNKNEITVSATDNNYLNNSSWQYAITETKVCNSQTTGWQTDGLSSTTTNSRSGKIVIDLSRTDVNDAEEDQWICIRVADNLDSNYGYRNLKIDVVAPVVTVTQRNSVLTASSKSSGVSSSTWRYVTDSHNFDCDEDAFDIFTVRSSRTVYLNSNHINDYFCFRVSDSKGNIGYSRTHRVRSLDTTPPTISLQQVNDVLKLSASGNADDQTWGWDRVSKSQPDDCEDQSYRDANDDQTVDLDEDDISYWFCIRVADAHGNYSYKAIKIKSVDATHPSVNVVQTVHMLTASSASEDLDTSSWQYAISRINDEFDCDEDNNNLRFNSPRSTNKSVQLQESDHNKFYCFRVKDKSGNFGYGLSQQVFFDAPPKLTVVQKSHLKRLEVSTDATDVDGYTWAWSTFNRNPGDCSKVAYTEVDDVHLTLRTNKIVVSDIADSSNGNYYCFRVADTSSEDDLNYGYAKHRYDITPAMVRFNFDVDTNILTVSSTSSDVDHSTWRYAKFSSQPNCDGTTELAYGIPAQRQFTLTEADNNHWLCFRVANSGGYYAYGLYLVENVKDDMRPVINITQTPHLVIASSASKVLDVNSWRYVITVNEPSCDLSTNLVFSHNQASPNQLSLNQVSHSYNWICFKVATKQGQVGYAKVKIDRQSPIMEAIQNNAILEVKATDDNLNIASWQYLRSEAAIDCRLVDNSKYVSIKVADDSRAVTFELTKEDNGLHYCISVADTIGHRSYTRVAIADLQLDAPKVSVKQSGNYLKFSVTTDVDKNSWYYTKSLINAKDIDCQADNDDNLNFAKLTAANIKLDESDNGRWYCLKVTGDNGIDGYAKVLVANVDTAAPGLEVVKEADSVVVQADEEITKWQYVILEDSENCNAVAFASKSTVFEGNQFTITAADDGIRYCFRAYDKAGNHTYKIVGVDYDKSSVKDTAVITATPTDKDDQPKDSDKEDDSDDDDDSDRNNLLIIAASVAVGLLVVTGVVIFINHRKQDDGDDVDNFL